MRYVPYSMLVTSPAALVLACGGATEPASGAPDGASHDETVGAPSSADGDGNGGTPVGGTVVGGTVVGGTPVDVGSALDEPDEPLPGPLAAGPEEPPPPASCLAEPGCPWSTRAAMPDYRRGQAAVAWGGSIYLIGGMSGEDERRLAPKPVADPPAIGSVPYTAVRAYDPMTMTWTEKAPLVRGLYVLTAHELDGKIYVFGGYGESSFDPVVQEYDPATDSWRLREPLPTPRYIFTSAVVAGRAYVIGGQGPAPDPEAVPPWDYRSSVDIFDPALGWSSGAPSPEPLAGGASCALDGRIFVFGGEVNNLTSVYDVAADSWSQATPSAVARNGHACVRVGSAFYLIGGRDSARDIGVVEKYEPATDRWLTLDPMPTPRYWLGAAAFGEEIFVFGGDTERASAAPPNYALSNAVEVLAVR